MPTYFDIHSHLNFPQFDDDRDEVLARMREHDVWTTTVGTNSVTSREAIDLAEKHDGLFACIGLHPVDEDEREFTDARFEEFVRHEKVVAVGETGLDYNHADPDDAQEVKRQKENFDAQIAFAVDHNKPLMIHCRDAYDDLLDILEERKKEYGEKLRGNMHFFAGEVVHARRALDIDFTLSFTGVITFVPSFHEVVEYVPLEKVMAETDAPFVAPVPERGKRNEPSFVRHTVEAIARIKDEDTEKVRTQTAQNALDLFSLS